MRFLAILLLPAICFAQVELQGRVITRDSTLRGVKGVIVTLVGQNLTAVTDSNGYWSMSKTTTQVSEKDRATARPVPRNIQLVNGRLTLVIGGRDASGRLIAGSTANVPDFAMAQGLAARTAAVVDTITYTNYHCDSTYGSLKPGDVNISSVACDDAERVNGYGTPFLTDTVWSTVRPSTDTMVRSYDITVNPKVIHGYFKDPRDGQVYPYATIPVDPALLKNSPTRKSYVWMTENLNYKIDSSWVLGNSKDNEVKYGRLYNWATAMGYADKCNDTSAQHLDSATWTLTNTPGCERKVKEGGVYRTLPDVCPTGWHLPSKDEVGWLDSAGANCKGVVFRRGEPTHYACSMVEGGLDLAERVQWSRFSSFGNGTDRFGFHAIPSGSIKVGSTAIDAVSFSIWTTEVLGDAKLWGPLTSGTLRMFGGQIASRNPSNRRDRVSVRCVKNY